MNEKIRPYTLISFITEIMKPFKRAIFVMLIVTLISSINLSVRAYLLKLILNGLEAGDRDKLAEHVLLPILLFLGAYFFTMASHRYYNYYIEIKSFPLLRQNIMSKGLELLMDKNYNFYQDNYSGNLTNKLNDLKNSIPGLMSIFINNFIGYVITFVSAFFPLWMVSPRFGYIMIVSVVIFIMLAKNLSKNFNSLSSKAAEYASVTTGKIVDIFSNIVAVYLFANKEKEKSDFNQALNDTRKAEEKLQWNYFWIWLTYSFVFLVIQILNFYFLYQGRKEGIISIGDFSLVLTINLSIIDLLWGVSSQYAEFSRYTGVINQALKAINHPIEFKDKIDATDLIVNNGSIIFDKVKFNYSNSKTLFDGLSVEIKPGEKVGLVGFSGGGKSSFINLILKLYNVSSGRILIDGQEINNVTQSSLLKNIAIIPQDSALFHRSVMENIRYGDPAASDEQVVRAAKQANAHEFIVKSKNGYETLIGERGLKLSGGQRQRIAIARAILKNAPILILDEATSQLDTITENVIQQSLRELIRGKTTIVIAHRLSTILSLDRILVFSAGKIVEDGSHEDLITNGGTYTSLWQAQEKGFLLDK